MSYHAGLIGYGKTKSKNVLVKSILRINTVAILTFNSVAILQSIGGLQVNCSQLNGSRPSALITIPIGL